MSPIVAQIRQNLEGDLEFQEQVIRSFMQTYGIDLNTYQEQKDGSTTATGISLIDQLTKLFEECVKKEEDLRFFDHFVFDKSEEWDWPESKKKAA